jgi:hypothetical protein
VNPRAHGLGVAAVACGLLLCILPLLAWYSADLPTGSDSLTGYGASATTWVLPVAGLIMMATGVLCVWWRPAPGTRVARILGALMVVAAVVGVAWAARAALAPGIEVVAERAGQPAAPLDGDWSVTVLPAAWIAVATAALAGMVGILLLTARPDEMIGPDDLR